MPGAFKLDHLHPVKQILFYKFYKFPPCTLLSQFYFTNFTTFKLLYWGANSYYPRGWMAENWKNGNLPLWVRERDFSAWGIQTGPIAAFYANFVPQILQFIQFHAGRPILITPEGGRLKMRKGKSSELDETQGFGCAWGILTGPLAAL